MVERPDRFDTYLDTIRRETVRLERIIEDLLFLSRLDQNRAGTNFAPVDLNVLTRQFVDDRQLLAMTNGLELSLSPHPNLPSVWADEGLLGQVLSILLTNALNYTQAGRRVHVSTHFRQLDGKAGLGISPEDQQHLFERFFRGKVGRESGASGTGLGLAIAKEIVDRHHGELSVESEGIPGKGATLTVWLQAKIP